MTLLTNIVVWVCLLTIVLALAFLGWLDTRNFRKAMHALQEIEEMCRQIEEKCREVARLLGLDYDQMITDKRA